MNVTTHLRINHIAILFFNFCLFLGLTNPSNAQTPLTTALSNLQKLEEKPTEKVHLHLDRTVLAPGEDIWFKAYLLDGTFHTLSSESNNLHVDLISPGGEFLKSLIILINKGVGYGDFKLDGNDFKEGIYPIRAYTNFMRNFGDEIFFKQNILIRKNSEDKSLSQSNSKIDLQFFPEGGILVQNILNRMAFKAIDETGKGKEVSFTVFDKENNEVLKTQSIHKGIGDFYFTPENGMAYYAVINEHGAKPNKFNQYDNTPSRNMGARVLGILRTTHVGNK